MEIAGKSVGGSFRVSSGAVIEDRPSDSLRSCFGRTCLRKYFSFVPSVPVDAVVGNSARCNVSGRKRPAVGNIEDNIGIELGGVT